MTCTCGKIGTTGCFAHSWSNHGFHVSYSPRRTKKCCDLVRRGSPVMSFVLDRVFLAGLSVAVVFAWIYVGWRVIEAVTR